MKPNLQSIMAAVQRVASPAYITNFFGQGAFEGQFPKETDKLFIVEEPVEEAVEEDVADSETIAADSTVGKRATTINLREAALAHVAKGRRIFPVKNNKPLISKSLCPKCLVVCENTAAAGQKASWVCPLCGGPGGAGCKDATDDPLQVAEWWKRWPDAQIGMPTDGFIVVDVRGGKVGQKSFEALEAAHGKLPETLAQWTPSGGFQYIFSAPEGVEVGNSTNLLGRHIDVRANGEYIVLAPSVGAKGEKYQLMEDAPIAVAPDWLVKLLTGKMEPQQEVARLPRRVRPEESFDRILADMRSRKESDRNDTLFNLSVQVGRMILAGALPNAAIDNLAAAALDTGLKMDEVKRTVESGLEAARPKKPKHVANTEDSAADVFIANHGHNVRFCQGSTWLEYSEQGKIWRRGKTPSVIEKIRQTCRSLNPQGKASLSRAGAYKGIAWIAQNDPRIYTEPNQWDSHPMLLGTPSGVISLDGSPIDVPERELYLSKTTSVAPEKGVPVLWRAFIEQITLGNQGFQRYLQQTAGYCLTGSTKEQELFFAYGGGGNGKGEFLKALGNIMGDYAVQATLDVLTASKSGYSGHPTDIAMFDGARLVMASETENGRSWKESQVKSMTGGDKITARFIGKNNFTYQPQFKLFIISNNKPILQKADDAMRRRMNILPFNFKPTVVDRDLDKKLEAEYPQILNWMIEGCKDWLQHGFVKPQCVIDETNEYFAEQDLMAQWISENCEVAADAAEQAKSLCENWRAFFASNGENVGSLNVTRFGNEMKRVMGAYGIAKYRAGGGIVYRGIRLRPDDDEPPRV